MATVLELLKRLQSSTAAVGRESERRALELLPPLNEDEFGRLESQIPCPIPEDARDLFRYTRGFMVQHPFLHGMHYRLSTVDLSGLGAQFGLEQIFPHALSIADDGCGNHWVIDLTSDSHSWGPVFFASHDPAVIVYHTDSVAGFAEDALREPNPGALGGLEAVHGKATTRIWLENPGVMSFEDCAHSEDEELKTFARSLDASYQFIDLRIPKVGDGFSWGRFGPQTVNKRFGEKRIFAYQKKTKWERFKDAWRR